MYGQNTRPTAPVVAWSSSKASSLPYKGASSAASGQSVKRSPLGAAATAGSVADGAAVAAGASVATEVTCVASNAGVGVVSDASGSSVTVAAVAGSVAADSSASSSPQATNREPASTKVVRTFVVVMVE